MTSLLQLFEGHYWDSLEPKKNLVMDHVRAVLKFHDPAQTPRRTLDAMANRIELLKPIAAKSPDGAEWDRFIINVSPVERDRIVAALRTGDVAQASRNAVIDECVKAAFSVRYGSPSSRHDKNPKGWHLPRDCTPTDAAMHDNGCIDAAKAIRALSTVPERREPVLHDERFPSASAVSSTKQGCGK